MGLKKIIAIGAAVWLGIIAAQITYENTATQLKHGQHRFQGRGEIDSSVPYNAVKNGRLRAGIYKADDGNFSSKIEDHLDSISDYVNRALGQLGLEIEFVPRDIEDVWQAIQEDAPESIDYTGIIDIFRRGAKEEGYLPLSKDDTGTSTKELYERDDILILLYNSQSRGVTDGSSYLKKASIDYLDDDGNIKDVKLLGRIFIHEIAHTLGIAHSTVFPDIMGDSSLISWVIRRNPVLLFGPESRLEWEIIKYKQKKLIEENKFKAPQPTSLQYLGNTPQYRFYQRHGYIPPTK